MNIKICEKMKKIGFDNRLIYKLYITAVSLKKACDSRGGYRLLMVVLQELKKT